MSGRVSLPGALALVTGAGSGIGRATALALAGRKASVACVDIDGVAAERTAAECAEAGSPRTASYCADVADRSAMAELARHVTTEVGSIDVLVNNAGVGMTGGFESMSLDDWDWIRGINLDGVVNGCHFFGRPMLDRGRGHIVNVSSGLGYVPTATEIAYGTTKAAVLMFSQALRAGWARRGVGVSAICPGVINTAIIEHTRFVGSADEVGDRQRVSRLFSRGHPPEVVARAVVDAVERDRAVVPVGAEARVGWALHRLAPVRLQQWVARFGNPNLGGSPF